MLTNISGEESRTEQALRDIAAERARQKSLALGGNTDAFDELNTRNDWVAYVTAYAGRAANKVARNERQGEEFRANMVKTAALAVAAIEAYDRGVI